jgi:pyruvate/2-oxoacid:ferredoxin oxidoreductase beta subunit
MPTTRACSLYRYNGRGQESVPVRFPRSKDPFEDHIYTEGRYRMLQQSDSEVAKLLLGQARKSVHRRWQQYKQMTREA